jgi:23S rRNA (adenine2503-C2)-methyltransferase
VRCAPLRDYGGESTEQKKEAAGLNPEELREICREEGIAGYRGAQVFAWLQQRALGDFAAMTDIGKKDRAKLAERLDLSLPVRQREDVGTDGTRKYLFALRDGETIETVLMDYRGTRSRNRRSLCLSTQVGCPVGCPFCATGQSGYRRDLSAAEIVGQVLAVTAAARQDDSTFKVGNLVFMGMGEPFLNWEAFWRAAEILGHAEGQGIGMRKMTVSTCGVVPGIASLAATGSQMGLAISLHSARQDLRNKLVPLGQTYPLPMLKQACLDYQAQSGRRLTFEMALVEENAIPEEVVALREFLRGLMAHVNLIPVNPAPGSLWARPSEAASRAFHLALTHAGINATWREEKGLSIQAACGQLRQRDLK